MYAWELTALALLAISMTAHAAETAPPGWAWNARMAASAVTLEESPAEIEALADDLAAGGYTVFTVHPGPLCYDVLSFGDEGYYPAIKRLTDACHARGIRVVMKTMTLWHDKQKFPQYERTAGRRVDGSLTTYHLPPRPGSRAWYSCFNHPEIRRAHLQDLPKLLAATGMDGFMTDALIRPDMTACVCEYCRAKFEADTGLTLPGGDAEDFWENRDDPLYRAWLLWRFRSVSDFLAEINAALRAMDPPRYLVEYYAPGIPSMLTSATDHRVLLEGGACMIGQEIGVGPASQYNWRYILSKLNHVRSICERTERVPYAIIHNTHAQSCPALFRMMCWASGLRKWEYPEAYGAVRGVTVSPSARRWDREHEDLLTRLETPATVAIVYSRSSYVLVKGANRGGRGRLDSGEGEYFGWAQMLIDENVPYDSLVETELRPEVLSRYRALILPNIACMSAEACEAVRLFVADGGRLIASGLTSLYDGTGAQREDFGLAEILGVRHAGFLSGQAVLEPIDAADSGYCGAVEMLPDARQVATMRVVDAEHPAIVANGPHTYFAGNPGRETAHWVFGLGARGGTWESPTASGYRQAMREALGDHAAPLRAIDVPPGVVLGLQQQPDRGRTLIHALDLRCTEIEPDGAEVAKGAEVVYPHVPGPIVAEVDAPWPSRAYAISPDFSGRRPVSLARADGGRVRMSLPDLLRYALIVIEPDESTAEQPPPGPTPTDLTDGAW
ncbi:MAG: hypothetical protein GF393_04335, partial [Armatimonadia bacterium]|nr:hypothetical protein [Armatimonadia bacterium]